MSQQPFQTEVSQLLKLIIHSLYSHKEIFLRELISNSSDALDKLRYMTLTKEDLKSLKFDPKISLEFREGENPTLTITDTGVGMSKKELEDNLGTIARSGTKNFLSKLSGDAKKDSQLIGQFGVGFYSSFMVADKVEVASKKAGNKESWRWISDGQSGFEIKKDVKKDHGTSIVLHLNEEGKEFASRWRIDSLVKKYSDHIDSPIFLTYDEIDYDKDGKEKSKKPKTEQINDAKAFWTRSKNEIKKKEYKEFYKFISFDQDDPLLWIHNKVEGKNEYTNLVYIPSKPPFDLWNRESPRGLKLYIQRVFIMDDASNFLPLYLRFLRGVIDTNDLPLNVSREILQSNPLVDTIKKSITKRTLDSLKKLKDDSYEEYLEFWKEFGLVLKEGPAEDIENRELIASLMLFN